jgi:uncharacterized integral membrane protein
VIAIGSVVAVAMRLLLRASTAVVIPQCFYQKGSGAWCGRRAPAARERRVVAGRDPPARSVANPGAPAHTCRVAGDVDKQPADDRLLTPRRVVVGLIGLYLLLFVLLNTRRVHVSFVLFSVRTHLLTALLLTTLLGFAAGFFVGGRSRPRKKTRASEPPPPPPPHPAEVEPGP